MFYRFLIIGSILGGLMSYSENPDPRNIAQGIVFGSIFSMSFFLIYSIVKADINDD